MATAPTYNQPNADQYGAPVEPKSKGSGCVKGCLIVLIVLVVLALIAGIVIWLNWRSWAASLASQAFNQIVDQSDLPAEEKVEVKAQIDRPIQALRNGTMTGEQFGKLMENLTQSPLMSLIVVAAVDQKYLEKSGLSDDEKKEGRTNLRRVSRGVVDKKIPEAKVDSLMIHIADRNPQGHWQLRNQVSDADLRAFLEEAKAEADTAQIPAEPENIDISDEIKRVIDSALGAQ